MDEQRFERRTAQDRAAEQRERKRAREFDEAMYASLICRADSDNARQLSEVVVRVVTEHELAAGARKNKRNRTQSDLRIAVEAWLADLLKGSAFESTHGYVYRPLRPAGFSGQAVGYRIFRRLITAMEALGLLEVYGGFQTWGEDFAGKNSPSWGKATRYRASNKLLQLSGEHGIAPEDFYIHFFEPLPEQPLVLRGRSTRTTTGQKISGKRKKFEETEATRALSASIRELNSFFDTFDLRHGAHRGYLRVFNNGDDPTFNWNMGGRFYSHGEGNYQQIPKHERLRMLINDEPVCEIDIRASYLTILHAWAGEPFDPRQDPYDISELGSKFRPLVKGWIVASCGNSAPISKWSRDFRKDYLANTGKPVPKRATATEVGAKIMAVHPLLARLGEYIGGRKAGWAELMYAESEAMFATMLDLMHRGIPSLTVHDSIIVPISKHHSALRILRKKYRAGINANPVLVSHPPEGLRLSVPEDNQGFDLIEDNDQ